PSRCQGDQAGSAPRNAEVAPDRLRYGVTPAARGGCAVRTRIRRLFLFPLRNTTFGYSSCHRHLILNWFRAKGTISAGVVEGLNGVVNLTSRKAFGFRTAKGIEIALFHVLGKLPEPESTHRFC
ncbi:MAG: transposase, partial [Planctomycetes bacterium]|nr:transposase [Planctomycetota bacterium]